MGVRHRTVGGAKAVRRRKTSMRNAIIATAIPYEVDEVVLPEHIASLVDVWVLYCDADLCDESDRNGLKLDEKVLYGGADLCDRDGPKLDEKVL